MIYVIHLERETRRRDCMQSQLEALGLPFTFVPAVDGRTLDLGSAPGYDEARRTRLMGSVLTANQVACSLSHIGIFRTISESRDPYHLVLEDDVLFEDGLRATLDRIPEIRLPWDHLRLGGLRRRRFVPRQRLSNGVHVGYYTGPVWGAEGYALTPLGAKKLLAYRDLQLFIIDQAMERVWENRLDSLGVFPFQLRQAPESQLPSTIGYAPEAELARSRAQKTWRRRLRRGCDNIARRWYNLTVRGIFWDPPRDLFP